MARTYVIGAGLAGLSAALGLSRTGRAVTGLVEDAAAAVEIGLPRLGQFDAPGGAVEEAQAECRFEIRNAAGQGGVGDAGAFGKGRFPAGGLHHGAGVQHPEREDIDDGIDAVRAEDLRLVAGHGEARLEHLDGPAAVRVDHIRPDEKLL